MLSPGVESGGGEEAKSALLVLFSLPASPPPSVCRACIEIAEVFKQKAGPDSATNIEPIECYVSGTVTVNIYLIESSRRPYDITLIHR